MILPENRLIWGTGLVVLPCTTLLGLVPAAASLESAILVVFVFLVVLDAWRCRSLLPGLEIILPKNLRGHELREEELELILLNPRGLSGVRLLSLLLPSSFISSSEYLSIQLDPQLPRQRFRWTYCPQKRGRFQLDRGLIGANSPWGFWKIRRLQTLQSEFRVYPNLWGNNPALSRFLLDRSNPGLHLIRQIGQGREFEKLRDYQPGDNYQDIHWKATARRSKPITKTYQIEKTQEIYVALDCSRPSGRLLESGGASTTPLENYIRAALSLSLVAEKQGDLFGLITFSDRVLSFLRASSGHSFQQSCRDALYNLQTQDTPPNYEEVATTIRLRLRRRALIVFLTSLDDPVLTESFLQSVHLIERQHLIVLHLPTHTQVQPIFSRETVAREIEIYEGLAGHLAWRQLMETKKELARRSIATLTASPQDHGLELIKHYLEIKQRQLI